MQKKIKIERTLEKCVRGPFLLLSHITKIFMDSSTAKVCHRLVTSRLARGELSSMDSSMSKASTDLLTKNSNNYTSQTNKKFNIFPDWCPWQFLHPPGCHPAAGTCSRGLRCTPGPRWSSTEQHAPRRPSANTADAMWWGSRINVAEQGYQLNCPMKGRTICHELSPFCQRGKMLQFQHACHDSVL